MKYSVFNYQQNVFDVYEAGSLSGMDVPHMRTPRGIPSGIGFVPEALAVPLPKDAVLVGQSRFAQGVIATKNGQLSAAPAPSSGYARSWGKVLLGVAVGAFIFGRKK